MKGKYLEKESLSASLLGLGPDFLRGVAELVKELRASAHADDDKMSYWQLILLQSKVNGCSYRGDDLPPNNWKWPKNTWFQERLSHRLKGLEFAAQ